MIDHSGGFFSRPNNVRNTSSLRYTLDVARYPADSGGEDSLKRKAAFITYRIISGHFFYDGNKRTGIHTALEFLQANGVSLSIDDTIVDLAVSIASSEASEDELLSWLHVHQ